MDEMKENYFFNTEIRNRALTIKDEEIQSFINTDKEVIKYLMATRKLYRDTLNVRGEIDDWECDLEEILLFDKKLK